jgi:hypothetical protein
MTHLLNGRSHRVADISHRAGWLTCTCGARMAIAEDEFAGFAQRDRAPARADALAAAFTAHRREEGLRAVYTDGTRART